MRRVRSSRAARPALLLITAVLLVACGGDGEDLAGDVPADEPPMEEGDWQPDALGEEGDSLIPEDMRAEMEELAGQAAQATAEAAADDSDPDIQAPGSVTVSGDLQGSYSGLARCDAFGDSVSIAFGGLRSPFDWATEVPQIPGGVGVMLEFGGFSGAGTHGANLYLGSSNEVVAMGEGEVTLALGDLLEFPSYSLQVIEGSFEGTWSATDGFPEVGSGSVSGDIGVCSVPVD